MLALHPTYAVAIVVLEVLVLGATLMRYRYERRAWSVRRRLDLV